jgi:hypothetical protein
MIFMWYEHFRPQSVIEKLNCRPDFFGVGVRLSPLGPRATTGLLYQPQTIDDNECGAVGGMSIGKGNRSTQRNPAPVPLFPPQFPYDLTSVRTRAAVVGSRETNHLSYGTAYCPKYCSRFLDCFGARLELLKSRHYPFFAFRFAPSLLHGVCCSSDSRLL